MFLNHNPEEVSELISVIHKIEKEKEVLLDTINVLNQQIKEFEALKDEFLALEQEKENLQHAMFAVLYDLKQQEDKELDKNDLVQMLNNFGTLAINGLLNHPIKEHFEDKVLKGCIIAQQITEEYYDNQKTKGQFDWKE